MLCDRTNLIRCKIGGDLACAFYGRVITLDSSFPVDQRYHDGHHPCEWYLLAVCGEISRNAELGNNKLLSKRSVTLQSVQSHPGRLNLLEECQ